MELNALHKSVFRGLDDLQIAALQDIAKAYSCGLAADHGDSLRLLRLIIAGSVLSDRVGARAQIIDGNFTIAASLYGLIDAVTGNGEFHAGYYSVLRGFHNLGRAQTDADAQITSDRVIYLCGEGREILLSLAGRVHAIGPDNHTLTHGTGLCCGDTHGACRCFFCSDGQLISAYGEGNAVRISREGVITKHIVAVSQHSRVVSAVPFQINLLCLCSGFRKEAGNLRMALDTGYHAVVVGHNLIMQRMVIRNTIQNSIIATGVHMIKIAVAFTDDGFPN